MRRRRTGALLAVVVLGSGVACSPGQDDAVPSGSPQSGEAPVDGLTVSSTLATGLAAPWGLAPLPDGGALVTLRDEARIVLLTPDGVAADVTGEGAEQLAAETTPGGEGGLLGIAVVPPGEAGDGTADGAVDVVVYRTGESDNAVLSGRLAGTELGTLTTLIDGIPSARTHNGGQVAFGPDDYLYVSTGDADESDRAQDPDSLAGKILRLTLEGEPAPGNPDPDSPVWSMGHRNVQGLGWSSGGDLYASEFGQSAFDELNLIEAGANYGWPLVEGAGEGEAGEGDGFTEPVATWATDDASPSGVAVTPAGVWLAGLRGQRLWLVPFEDGGDGRATGEPRAFLEGELGRLRAVVPAGERGLWVLTNATDGRGDPGPDDDRLVLVTY